MKEIVKINVDSLRKPAQSDNAACFLRTEHCTIKVFNQINPHLFESLLKVILDDDK